MDNKSEWFDLKREKRELDAFLSTIPETEASASLDDGKKTEALPQITDAQNVKPLESFETMTRFDETAQSDEPVLAETPAPEKKTKVVDKANAYNFAPENKSAGIGRWIGILIILLIALLIGYFWLYPERGSKTIEIIKSYIPVLKTDQGATSSSAQGINLVNVRQKLVYNVTLEKSVRVIEGFAENSTPRPVSKIKIAANLYNSEGSLLASTESFGGNIIIDEKLESLDANGILDALKDVKTMEDRISPKGQIPFMMVFTSEPAGVFRLSVLPVDFKKH